jgi:hypothetical protein
MSSNIVIMDNHNTGFTNIIGALAMILSIVQMTGLINSLLEAFKRNEYTTKLDKNQLLFIIAETALWSIYGIKLQAFPIYLTNMALFLMYLVCVTCSFWFIKDISNLGKYVGISILCWILGYTLLTKNLAGFAAFIIKCLTLYFVYEKIKFCLEKKSNEGIDINELYVGTAAYVAWVIYGLFFAHYPFVWIPNLAFSLIYGFYLISYFWTIGKITDNGMLIVYTRKLFQVQYVEIDNDPKQMKKKLRDDF